MPLSSRQARIIQTIAPPSNLQNSQQYSRYIPTSESYLNSRIGEAAHISNIDGHKQKLQTDPSQRQQYQFNSPREVSETDLYLLGAIEKLVHRVDYMEKRLHRTEQIVYYLMAGNKQQQIEADTCPKNFTKIHRDCYHFAISERLNWKSAAQQCKSIGASLAEFESIEKFQNVVASLLGHQEYRGHDFWLGGLNPGLLWIWSTSAKPVNPSADLTSLSTQNKTSKILPIKLNNETLSVNFPEILGNGRCLRLSYNPTTFSYGYTGQDCSSRQHYMCIILDNFLENEINKIAKNSGFL